MKCARRLCFYDRIPGHLGCAKHSEPIFLCWDANWRHTEDDATKVLAADAQDAAETWAEQRFADDDYPRERDVTVKSPDGTMRVFEVTLEEVPRFVANEKSAPSPFIVEEPDAS